MRRTCHVVLQWMGVMAGGAVLLDGGCLPANFWADQGAELVNRSIFGAINALLAAMTGGTVQI